MNKPTLIISTLILLLAVFVGGNYWYKSSATTLTTEQKEALDRNKNTAYGAQNAKVTIVEFYDPACGTCRSFYPFVKEQMKANEGKIKLILRYAPFHIDSFYVSQMIEAARYQNKEVEALEVLYKYQDKWASHSGANVGIIWGFLAEVGIDIDKLKEDLKRPEVETRVKQDLADTKTLNVTGTPEFFVNGQPLKKFGKKELKELIDSAL